MEAGLLRSADQLLRSGARVEAQLTATLDRCDGIGHHLTYVVADTLTKLVRDIAGAPLLLANYVTDPRAMICHVSVLRAVLQHVQPEKSAAFARPEEVARRVRWVCRQHNLPARCGEVFAALVAEIYEVFRELDAVLARHVRKPDNLEILRRRLRHFYRAVCPELLVYAFQSLKLAVCMRALLAGCFRMSPAGRERFYATLRRAKKAARTLAAVNETHRENLVLAALLAKREARDQLQPALSPP